MEAQAQDAYEPQRKRMVEEIAGIARDTGAETGRAVFSERVMAAMAKVPRHEFVPAGQRAHAYANRPLPIGQGQTISQPYIVALMTELMDVQPGRGRLASPIALAKAWAPIASSISLQPTTCS